MSTAFWLLLLLLSASYFPWVGVIRQVDVVCYIQFFPFFFKERKKSAFSLDALYIYVHFFFHFLRLSSLLFARFSCCFSCML